MKALFCTMTIVNAIMAGVSYVAAAPWNAAVFVLTLAIIVYQAVHNAVLGREIEHMEYQFAQHTKRLLHQQRKSLKGRT